MTDCKTVQSQIDEFLDLTLDKQVQIQLSEHIDKCKACAGFVDAQRQFSASLKQMPVLGPSADFYSRVFINIERKQSEQKTIHSHRKGFVRGFSTAIAAGLALWVVVGLYPQIKQQPLQDPVYAVSMSLDEVQIVSLAFHTVNAVNNAKVTLKLPANMELVGYEGMSELTWNTQLKKGDNLLKLPMRAKSLMQGKIFAEIEHQNKKKSFSFDVRVKQSGATMEPFRLNVV
jgi:hypothetical protein